MRDGSEVLDSSPNGHLEERVEKLNAEIAQLLQLEVSVAKDERW